MKITCDVKGEKMKVFEFQCKIKFLKDVKYQNVYEKQPIF